MSQKNSRIVESICSKKEMSDINKEYSNRCTYNIDEDHDYYEDFYYDYDDYYYEDYDYYEDDFFVSILSKNAAESNLVFSKNGALECASSGSALVDFNARATEFRNAHESVIFDAAVMAFAENPVDFVKLVFQTGDIKGGKGERRSFNICMDWLVATHPYIAMEVLSLIPEFTRWDNLVRHIVSENKEIREYATSIVVEQFKKDLDTVRASKEDEMVHISLLAKWMPSLQTKKSSDKILVRHLLRSLHMQEREYRKALSELRSHLNIIEKAMSAKDYKAIDMTKLSSKQQLRYAKFFNRVMQEERHEYIQAVLRGEKKMNASVLNPLEIYHEYIKKSRGVVSYNEDYEALWSLISDKTAGNGNTLVIRDGSFSMKVGFIRNSNATMLDAASAMAIYCAEHMTGPLKNKFITFSSRPQIVDLSECHTLAEKINHLFRYNDCTNTNIEATFDLILNAAIEGNLSQDEIPSYLLIMSDMEFDRARTFESRSRAVLFDLIREKWNAAGYEMPTLVFWQLNGKRTIYPEIDSKNGIIFLSGFSVNELELVMAGRYEDVKMVEEATKEVEAIYENREEKVFLTPIQQLERKLANPRYDVVEDAVRRGLEKEKG